MPTPRPLVYNGPQTRQNACVSGDRLVPINRGLDDNAARVRTYAPTAPPITHRQWQTLRALTKLRSATALKAPSAAPRRPSIPNTLGWG